MSNITANDLKTRGVAAIEATLADRTEAVVSVRGADRYVVMELAHYHYLRECELEAALAQSRAEVAEGRVVKESAAEHVVRLQALNAGRSGGAGKAKAVAKRAAAKRPTGAGPRR